MENRTVRLSKPLYELLPYFYIGAGLLGFLGAHLLAGKIWSDIALVVGIVCVLGGAVLLLRRKDYRDSRSRYSGGSLDSGGDDNKPRGE